MSASVVVPASGAEADVIAAAVLACPGVVALHHGGTVAVATYLAGRRVVGVQVGEERIRVAVVATLGVPVAVLDDGIRRALAPFALGRAVDIHVADVAPPPVAVP